jgi:hypothetical protein
LGFSPGGLINVLMVTQRASTIAEGSVGLQVEPILDEEFSVKSSNELSNITSDSPLPVQSVTSDLSRNTTPAKVTEREMDMQIQSQSYLLQRVWKFSKGNPNAIIGSGTAFDALNFLPIERTMRNAELLYFCKATLPIHLYYNDTNLCHQFTSHWLLILQQLMAKICLLHSMKGLPQILYNPLFRQT